MPFKIELDGGLAVPLGLRPIVVGRAPGCELRVGDETVSSRHAELWADADAVWVRDLGSRNGVRVAGDRIKEPTRVGGNAEIVVGTTTLRVREVAGGSDDVGDLLVIEELASGHGTAFFGDRFRIGEGADVHLHVAGAPDIVLLRVGPGEVLLGRDDDTTPLPLGAPFDVAGVQLVVRPAPPGTRATRALDDGPPRCEIHASLTAGPGPIARVLQPSTGRELVVTAENRATLLWVLAREGGWVSEQEVLTAVWGRAAGATSPNLRVLVCRLRADLRAAGLDPWILEHRAGHLRARVDAAQVD